MTKSNPRASASKSLASLQIDTNPRAVIDEISALRLHRPSAVDYAAFVNNPACVADMVERARLHADQVARFVTLAQVSPPSTVTQNLPQLYALVLLNMTATVAVAIMPAHNGADRHARCQQGAAFLQSLENPDENELRHLAEIAFELPHRDAHTIARDAIAFASRGHGEEPKPSRATIHWIEENATLRNWLKRRTEVSVLLAEARQHAIMLDRFEASFDQDDLPPIARDAVAEACEGALHQHVLALAELALSPVTVTTDQILEAAHASVTTRTKLQAGLLIAIAVGQHYRAMLAANPC
ncbi:hypothetical protein [Bosea sp. RAC05]|uniref:hypothetical protein n=1 Tax=Bosea sp. RAC05 TaxID=1842539 RepID=UPI0012375AA2|nr:hypothetical protein [Bosea sp. RAC05]